MPRTELIARRTARSKTFDNGDGTLTVELGKPKYYRLESGEWVDIDCVLYGGNTEVVDADTGETYTHATGHHPVDFRINKFKQGFKFADKASGVRFVVKPLNARQSTGIKSLNTVRFPQAWSGIDALYTIIPEGVKANYTKTAACDSIAFSVEGTGDFLAYHREPTYTIPNGIDELPVPWTFDGSTLVYDLRAVPVGAVIDPTITNPTSPWTVPVGVTSIDIAIYGAGGGGGSSNNSFDDGRDSPGNKGGDTTVKYPGSSGTSYIAYGGAGGAARWSNNTLGDGGANGGTSGNTGWTSLSGGASNGAAGGTVQEWPGGNGGSGGKLSNATFAVIAGNTLVITYGAGGLTQDTGNIYGGAGSVVITYTTATAPTVTDSAPTSVTSTTATGNGNVTSDGGATITERGVVWGASANPTIAGSKDTASGTTGAFEAHMTSLTAGTLYYWRMYATNSVGTTYSTGRTFTTAVVRTKTYTLSSIVKKITTKTYTLDGVVGSSKIYTLDAVVKKMTLKNHSLDLVLVNRRMKTFTLNGVMKQTKAKTHILNAVMKQTKWVTYSLDAIVVAVQSYFYPPMVGTNITGSAAQFSTRDLALASPQIITTGASGSSSEALFSVMQDVAGQFLFTKNRVFQDFDTSTISAVCAESGRVVSSVSLTITRCPNGSIRTGDASVYVMDALDAVDWNDYSPNALGSSAFPTVDGASTRIFLPVTCLNQTGHTMFTLLSDGDYHNIYAADGICDGGYIYTTESDDEYVRPYLTVTYYHPTISNIVAPSTASYTPATLVVDDSYPIELYGLIDTGQVRSGKADFWASAERLDGSEFLVSEFKTLFYFNQVCFKFPQKPCIINLFYSTDMKTWIPVIDENGIESSYSVTSWGGKTSADSMLLVEFNTELTLAKGVKLTFDRVNVPLGSGSAPFPYSIDVFDLVIQQVIETAEDYAYADGQHTYADQFGNGASSQLVTYPADNVTVDDSTYWVSKANTSADSVECFYFSLENKAFDAVYIDPVYSGAQLNLYYSNDESLAFKDKVWTPIPGIFRLAKGMLNLPVVSAKYVKMEFTDLTAIPYQVVIPRQKVQVQKFPPFIDVYYNGLEKSTVVLDGLSQLLLTPNTPDLLASDGYLMVGITNPDQAAAAVAALKAQRLDSGIPDSLITPQNSLMYQTDLALSNNPAGTSMAQEIVSVPSTLQPVDNTPTLKRFWSSCVHDYRTVVEERSTDIAYLVGLRKVQFYLLSNSDAIGNRPFFETFANERVTKGLRTWQNPNGMLLHQMNPSVYESNAFFTYRPFRSFSFFSQQRRPDSVFMNGTFEIDPTSSSAGDGQWFSYATGTSDSIVSWSNAFAQQGGCLRVDKTNANSANDRGGAKSSIVSIVSGGTAKVSGQIYVPDALVGMWAVEVQDINGAPIVHKFIQPSRGKWTPFDLSFSPEPYGGWWNDHGLPQEPENSDYSFRIPVIIESPFNGLSSDDAVYVSSMNSTTLSHILSNSKDLRVVYFDGKNEIEIDRDYTDTNELWFKLQADIQPNETCFNYFIYYDNPSETTSPMSSFSNIFSHSSPTVAGTQTYAAGLAFGSIPASNAQSLRTTALGSVGEDGGSFSMKYTPAHAISSNYIDGSGKPIVRFLADAYTDGGGHVLLYIYGRQMWLVFFAPLDEDENTYESSYAINAATFASGTTYSIVGTWGLPGSYWGGGNTIPPEDADAVNRRSTAIYVDGTLATDVSAHYSNHSPLTYNSSSPRNY